MIPRTAEEYVLFLQGESLALQVLVAALLQTTHDRASLRAAIKEKQSSAEKAFREIPPANLTRFRYEQLLEQMCGGFG